MLDIKPREISEVACSRLRYNVAGEFSPGGRGTGFNLDNHNWFG